MRKTISLVILSFLCFSLVGCNNATIEKKILVLEDNIKELNEKNEKLNKEVIILKNDKESLEQELDELKNGAENLIIQLRIASDDKDLKEVERIAKELNNRFRGTKEDMEGQKLLAELQDEIEWQRKLDEEEKNKTQKQRLDEIIKINDVSLNDIDSAGAAYVSISFTNTSDKTIKYINFDAVGLNVFGDRIKCQLTGIEVASLKSTGPYLPNEGSNDWNGYNYWELVWYNATIREVQLVGIQIDYTDGTSIELTREECNLLMS